MSELSLPPNMHEHLMKQPYATHYAAEIEPGVHYHAFRDEAWNSDDITLVEAALDAFGLAQTCEKTPAISTFLGRLGLQAAYYDTGPTSQLVRYPDVEWLTDAIAQLRWHVPAYSPPKFADFDGDTYSAQQFLEALADGTVLVSSQASLEHDMVQHAPAWLSMPPRIFTAVRRYAENALQNPGAPDKYGRTNVGRFMDDIDITFGVSPSIGNLMVDAAKIPPADTTTALIMQEIVGSEGSGQAALREIADYALFVGNEIRN